MSADDNDKESFRRVGEKPVTSVLKSNEIPVVEGKHNADDDVLVALGYK